MLDLSWLIHNRPEESNKVHLTWTNVGIGLAFILLDIVLSASFGLQLETSLLVAALRCLVQLTIMGYVLERVFETGTPLIVFAIVLLLIFLGAFETTFNRAKHRHDGMFTTVLISLSVSIGLVGLLGARFALGQTPVYEPTTLIPVIGMLTGNAISAVAIASNFVLKELTENKERVMLWLSFGSTRWEVGQALLLRPALKMALLPTITQMSVMGLIAIPGMMTGSLLGGAPVDQAVHYQQIIMFLIAASSALSVLLSTTWLVFICIDSNHMLRTDRISNHPSWMYRLTRKSISSIYKGMGWSWRYITCRGLASYDDDEERRPLLS